MHGLWSTNNVMDMGIGTDDTSKSHCEICMCHVEIQYHILQYLENVDFQ